MAWIGRYAEAERMHRRALEIRQRIFAADHPATATEMSNLGGVLCLIGDSHRYAEAESLQKQALAIREAQLGPNHPETMISINNLGRVYQYQQRYDEAEAMFRQKLALEENTLPEHPSTLNTLHNLGLVLGDKNQHDAAERIHRENLTVRDRVLGSEHPDTLKSAFHLAGSLEHLQRDEEEMLLLYQRAFEGRKKVLRPGHPDLKISEECHTRLSGKYNLDPRLPSRFDNEDVVS
jgi:tetratricopeptide (TPR) repeat protein